MPSPELGASMKRRVFITLLGGAAATWPLAGRAQQRAMPVIGLLGSATASEWTPYVDAFHQGLRETGYVEGRNLAIEARWANNQYDQLPPLVAELVQRRVTVIVAFSTPAAHAAKAATATIPIVFTTIADPVQIGLVASLNRPGGNITGSTDLDVEVGPKRLEILHEAVPTAKIIALLVNPTNSNHETQSRGLQVAASKLGLQLHVLNASTERDFDTAFATLRQTKADGLVIASDVFFNSQSRQLAALTIRHAVPAIFQNREFAAAGGFMTYSGSIRDLYHQAGIYTGRILNGEKPADLPVVQGTKLELIINLKTAKALGITIPLPLLGRADEVIE
jgi:putative tryptophan/tyrosine transport system substrate-binding protein